MKKSLIVAIALPVVFMGAGFAAGKMLAPVAGTAEEAAAPPPKDDAISALDAAAEQEADAEKVAEAQIEALAPIDEPAAAAEPSGKYAANAETAPPEPQVVGLGRMTIPVYKPASVTYVVADFGVSVPTENKAEYYRTAENATRLRDAILLSMTRAAGKPVLSGAAIDTDALSSAIRSELKPEFGDIDEVLFLSLFKMDVPRS
jgi:hypothetical protein